MKTLLPLLAITLMCFTAPAPPVHVLHQPDFTQAHFYSFDSIYVVQEFNTGSAHTLQSGESFFDKCDYMACIDSVATYWKIKGVKGTVTSYKKRSAGRWTIYVNGVKNGMVAMETTQIAATEEVDGEDDEGNSYLLRMEYYKCKITKADAQ